jgi:hypothetical protein
MKDKRENNRLDILGHVEIKRGSSKPSLDALIGDVSYSGIRVYVKEHLAGQVEISRCHFVDAMGGVETEIAETVHGRVMWIKQKGKWYSVGIKFDSLNSQDHPAILAFLDKHIKVK